MSGPDGFGAPRLRPYQQQAITDLRAAVSAGALAPLYVLPTGGGKSVIFTALASGALARGRRVVVLAHRRELVAQGAAHLARAGLHVGIIAPWATADPSAPAQVASVQTLVRRLDATPEPDLLVIDEAHHAAAGSWRAIREAWPKAIAVGVTATPIRLDGAGLGEVFDALVLGPSARELTADGYLVPAEVWCPSVPDLAGVRTRGGDWSPEDLERALERSAIVGDAVASFQQHVPDGTAVAFCVSVAAARSTAAAFNASGIQAAVLTGDASGTSRQGVLDDLSAERIRVLCTVDVVSEGFDLPQIAAAILLRPTKSLGLYLQQVGRALRPAPGKTRAIILDHAGNALRHGLPSEDRDWSLDGIQRRHGRPAADDDEAVSVRQCMSCYAVFETGPVCPFCGSVPAPTKRELREREGELRLLAEREAARVAAVRQAEERRTETLEDLLRIEKERGYKKGWARLRWAIRQKRRAS